MHTNTHTQIHKLESKYQSNIAHDVRLLGYGANKRTYAHCSSQRVRPIASFCAKKQQHHRHQHHMRTSCLLALIVPCSANGVSSTAVRAAREVNDRFDGRPSHQARARARASSLVRAQSKQTHRHRHAHIWAKLSERFLQASPPSCPP